MSLEVEIKDRVCTLRLNRPEQRNSLDRALIRALKEALASAERDPRVRAVVLCGQGPSFCEGLDVQELAETQPEELDHQLLTIGHVVELYLMIRRHKKVVVAQVAGRALSSGCTLALCADFVFAAEGAEMGYPDVQWGFVPAVSIPVLRQRLAPAVIRRLLLGAQLYTGADLLQMGLADACVPPAELTDHVQHYVQRPMMGSSPGSVELTKRLLADLADMPEKEAINFAARIASHSRKTVEYEIGLKAFLAKKQPDW